MSALLAINSNSAGESNRRSRGLYTYLVSPIGPVQTVGCEEHAEELVMRASLIRQDGSERQHVLRVRPTDHQPDLVDRVRALLSKNVAVRLVVRFENAIHISSGRSHVRTEAIAETLLEPSRAPAGVQLNMFG